MIERSVPIATAQGLRRPTTQDDLGIETPSPADSALLLAEDAYRFFGMSLCSVM